MTDDHRHNEAPLRFEVAEARHGAALVELFERTGTPCHCQYWHFTGDKNAWLERLFHAPELNRDAFLSDLAAAELKGVVALRGERAVGWLKLTAASRVQKLYEQRLYKGLPCLARPTAGVLTIGCVLVEEDERRQGVATSLVRHAVAVGREVGAARIEAFPRRSEHASAPELWTGPPSSFLAAGFEIVSDFGPYPVLVRQLRD